MSNNYLDQLNKTLSNSEWLKELYGSEKSEQISKIKGLFISVSENNNMSEADKERILSQAEAYAKKVEILEAKMAVLLEQIEKNEKIIKEKTQELTNLITNSENKSKTYRDKFESWVDDAITTVMKDKNIGTDEKAYYIEERINAFPSRYKNEVNKALANLKTKEGEINGLIGDMDQLISERNILEKQYGSTKSIYELLNSNAQKINKMSSDYTNNDADANVPIYSLEKTDIVQGIFDNPNYVAIATNSNKEENTTRPTLDSIKEKYKEELEIAKTATPGVDINRLDNQAVAALKDAVDKGLLNDLASAGLNISEIENFFFENFKGVEFTKTKEGRLSIPWGHRSEKDIKDNIPHNQTEVAKLFASVHDFIKNYSNSYSKDTWSDVGNTITSNEQLSALGRFVDDNIINQLANNEPRFTFKEAMYALFNLETGLFKDCGITYDLNEQTGEPKYSIGQAGDKETANMYEKLAKQIESAWGVTLNDGLGYEPERHNEDNYVPKRTDPLSFMLGNDQYSLIIDRDKNGTFDNTTEFIGGLDGTSWVEDLKALDTNNDNKLSGDELKELKLLRSTYEDNAQVTKNEDEKFLRSETTIIDNGFTTAASLGIEELDFSAFLNEDGLVNTELANNRAKDILGNDKVDINNSNVFDFNNALKVNIGGEDISIKRKDETNELMQVIYKGALGESFNIDFNKETDVDAILNKNYGEYDNFDKKFNAFFVSLSLLKGTGRIAKTTYESFVKLLDELNNAAKAKVDKADFENKGKQAQAYGFNKVSPEIRAYAQKNGLQYDNDVAGGIYMKDASLSIEEIAIECNEVLTKAANNDVDNLAMVISALKSCSQKGVNFNDEVNTNAILGWIKDGEVKSADDIVEKLKNEYKPEENVNVNIEEIEIKYNNPREKEFVEAFTKAVMAKISENANILDKEAAIIKALACLCNEKITNDNFNSEGKDASKIADEILKKYEKEIFG